MHRAAPETAPIPMYSSRPSKPVINPRQRRRQPPSQWFWTRIGQQPFCKIDTIDNSYYLKQLTLSTERHQLIETITNQHIIF